MTTVDRSQYDDAVKGPGKFEGEPGYVAYYYEQSLDGMFDYIDFPNETLLYTEISAEDIAIFPELAAHKDLNNLESKQYIVLSESDQGFVYHVIVSKEQIDKWEKEAEKAAENEY